MNCQPLVEHTFTEASELFDAVVLGNALKYTSGLAESPWAFRGHAEEYPLLPSSLRTGARLLSAGGHWQKVPENATYSQRAELEMNTLRVFFHECDRNGLRVPGDSHALRDRLYSMVEDLRERQQPWPPPDVLPLMAIAQHHGYRRGYSTGRETRRSSPSILLRWVPLALL